MAASAVLALAVLGAAVAFGPSAEPSASGAPAQHVATAAGPSAPASRPVVDKALVAVARMPNAPPAAPAALAAPPASLSPPAASLWQRVMAQADHRQHPFVILDKRAAKLFVFNGQGALQGESLVLLGLAVGDDSVPGIGHKAIADIRPAERTTPAGRFAAEPGRNHENEDIVWIDYDAAVSMHRLRASAEPRERRPQRLASESVADNRISYGCVNVPPAFYDAHIRPTLGQGGGVVYVLPETRSLEKQFPALFGAEAASPA